MERKDDEHISGRTLKGEKDMVVRRTVSAAFAWEQYKEILASGNAKETCFLRNRKGPHKGNRRRRNLATSFAFGESWQCVRHLACLLGWLRLQQLRMERESLLPACHNRHLII